MGLPTTMQIAPKLKTALLVGCLSLSYTPLWTHMASAADTSSLLDGTSAYSWGGLYAGVHFGVGDGKLRSTIGSSTLDHGFSGGDHDGGGALVGWNFEYRNLVFGLEGALSINEIKSSYAGGLLPEHSSDYVWHAEARGRVGYPIGRFLPYVSAGLVAGEFYQQSGANLTGPSGEMNGVLGYTLGAGLDVQLSGGFALRSEYLYQNFGKRKYTLSSVPTELKTDFDVHLGRVALLYHFGHPQTSANTDKVVLFSGASLGAGLGFTQGKIKLNKYANDTNQTQSLTGGLKVGYLFPIKNFRIGGEASLNLHTGSSNFNPVGVVDSFDYRLMWHASVRGKIGYVHGRYMPYIAAGPNLGQFTVHAQPNDNTTLEPFKNGYSLIAGVEYAVSDRISVDAAYGYNAFNGTSINTSGHTTRVRHAFHQMRLGMVVR